MKTAKENFLERVSTVQSILVSPPTDHIISTQNPVTHADHNAKSRTIRNGLAIVSFNYIEDFIKSRVGEALDELRKGPIKFNDLPSKIKELASLNALEGITFQASLLKKKGEDYLTFIQEETKVLASSRLSRYSMSRFSFGYNKSNLLEKDISTALKSFCVEGGWKSVQTISSLIQSTIHSPETDFRNAASRRHQAAHVPDADSLLVDIDNFAKNSKTIAFAFDALISKTLYEIKNENFSIINETKKIKASDIKVRFLIKDGDYWKEYTDLNNNAIKRHPLLVNAKKEIKKKPIFKKEILLVKDDNNDILDWIT